MSWRVDVPAYIRPEAGSRTAWKVVFRSMPASPGRIQVRPPSPLHSLRMSVMDVKIVFALAHVMYQTLVGSRPLVCSGFASGVSWPGGVRNAGFT